MKLLLEKPDVPPEEVENIDVSVSLVALTGFIARFVSPLSYRIRLKLCALCDCACERTETLTLRTDTTARHKIIDVLMDWVQNPSAVRFPLLSIMCSPSKMS
jgi:neurofibromin 1